MDGWMNQNGWSDVNMVEGSSPLEYLYHRVRLGEGDCNSEDEIQVQSASSGTER